MKKTVHFLIFVFICFVTILFLQKFTRVGEPHTFYEWDSVAYTDEKGNTQVTKDSAEYGNIDINTKGYYTFSVKIDDINNGDYIATDFLECNTKIYFDDDFVYSCSYEPSENQLNMNNIRIPFPASTKECNVKFVCNYPHSDTVGIFPPMLKVTSDMSEDSFRIAISNYYAIPAGILAFVFIVICGIYLLGSSMGKPDYSLLLLAAASVGLSAYEITSGDGGFFLPQQLSGIILSDTVRYGIPLAIVLYMIINRKKKIFGFFILFCIGILVLTGITYCISLFTDKVYSDWINTVINTTVMYGVDNGVVHWMHFAYFDS